MRCTSRQTRRGKHHLYKPTTNNMQNWLHPKRNDAENGAPLISKKGTLWLAGRETTKALLVVTNQKKKRTWTCWRDEPGPRGCLRASRGWRAALGAGHHVWWTTSRRRRRSASAAARRCRNCPWRGAGADVDARGARGRRPASPARPPRTPRARRSPRPPPWGGIAAPWCAAATPLRPYYLTGDPVFDESLSLSLARHHKQWRGGRPEAAVSGAAASNAAITTVLRNLSHWVDDWRILRCGGRRPCPPQPPGLLDGWLDGRWRRRQAHAPATRALLHCPLTTCLGRFWHHQ